jgi:hypothetical protein
MAGVGQRPPAAQSGSLSLHTGMSPDELAALLPPKARQRLETLSLRRDDAHRLIPEGDTVRQLNAERFNLERALQRLQAPAGEGGHSLPDDDLRVIVAKRNLDKLTSEAKALAERYAQRGQAFQAIAQIHTAAMAWVRDGRRLRSAVHPRWHCEHDREIQWPVMALRGQVYNSQLPSFAATEVTDTLALFAWLHRDQLIAALDRQIDSESDDGAALTHEAREQQAAEVQGDLMSTERDEATLMFRGWADGLSILPRPDLAPAALLNVQLVTPPAINTSGSSPERADFDLVGGGRRR